VSAGALRLPCGNTEINYLSTMAAIGCGSDLQVPNPGLKVSQTRLNALLLIPNIIIPEPRSSRVTGQGKGHPNSGFGICANSSIESTINDTPARMRIHFDAVNILVSFGSNEHVLAILSQRMNCRVAILCNSIPQKPHDLVSHLFKMHQSSFWIHLERIH
jgi:hypothetical protein